MVSVVFIYESKKKKKKAFTTFNLIYFFMLKFFSDAHRQPTIQPQSRVKGCFGCN